MRAHRSSLSGAAFLFLLSACTKNDDVQPLPEEVDASVPGETPDLALPAPDLSMMTTPPDLAPAATGCTGKPKETSGTRTLMMMSGGKQRTYLLHIPTKYDETQPTSLVFAFHGLSDKAVDFIKYIDIEREADSRNVIAIVPQGLGFIPGWNAGNCCGEPQLFKVDDVGFVREMIAAAKRDLCIDDKRIFAMGFSNGGMFSHRLACELSDVFAAVGPVSGGPMVPECKPTQPISILHMHGTEDPTCGYHGGGVGSFPDIPMAIEAWAMRDTCTGAAKETYKNGAVTCMTYDTCAKKSEVQLCTVDKGQHTWPGSANGTPDLKGTAAIFDFFAAHGR
jgi:polyhydroxybutyrate depolymerase